MNLDVNTVLLFTVVIHFSNMIVMIYLKRIFNLKFEGYNSFIAYFGVVTFALIFLLIRENSTNTLWFMLYMLTMVTAFYFILNGFLEFYGKAVSKKVYIIFIIIFAILVHFAFFIGLKSHTILFILIFHDFAIHGYILYINLQDKALKRNETQVISTLNIFFIVITIGYFVIMVLDYQNINTFLEPVIFYSGGHGIASILLLTGIIHLIISSTYKEIIKTSSRLHIAQKVSQTGSWELDLKTNKIWASVIAFEIYEIDRSPGGFIPLEQVQLMTHDEDRDSIDTALYNLIEHNEPYDVQFRLIAANGKNKHIASQAMLEYDAKGNPSRVVGVFRDITYLKNKEDELIYTSYHDFLTGLHNRRFIDEEFVRLDNEEFLPFSIIIGDLNNLKLTNDTFGHKQGDEHIISAANILKKSTRHGEIVGRTGGDEFVILLPNTTEEQTNTIIERITINMKIIKNNDQFPFNMSLGTATKNSMDEDIDIVFKRAEDNMYKDKIHRGPSLRRRAIDIMITQLFKKDPLSEIHSRRVSTYAVELAKAIHLPTEDIKKIETAALLHDIGKVLVSDEILKSNQTLTSNEYNIIKEHTITGYRILNSVDDLKEIAKIVLYHHEKLDGSGYPQGIKADDIPLESKIISIADSFDAMTGQRLYRDPLPIEEVIEELKKNTNTQFDKKLIEVFINLIEGKRIEV